MIVKGVLVVVENNRKEILDLITKIEYVGCDCDLLYGYKCRIRQ
jgi:hypothetical protein